MAIAITRFHKILSEKILKHSHRGKGMAQEDLWTKNVYFIYNPRTGFLLSLQFLSPVAECPITLVQISGLSMWT